jgi:hypothetical protein
MLAAEERGVRRREREERRGRDQILRWVEGEDASGGLEEEVEEEEHHRAKRAWKGDRGEEEKEKERNREEERQKRRRKEAKVKPRDTETERASGRN